MKIVHIVGARPNFIKTAPVITALCEYDSISQILVHTGQHYDDNMSEIFFHQLGLPEPDVNLEVGSGSHAFQTGQVMIRLEKVFQASKPDLVLVYGDVNSTVAAALVCAKACIPVAHVEAGLRSFDRSMPEEINRIVTDSLADLLFTPSLDGNNNLAREGIPPEKIHFVGNVMIDTLIRLLPFAQDTWEEIGSRLNLSDGEAYGVVTLHRPSNVDDPLKLAGIVDALNEVSRDIPILFPVHPRTLRRIHGIDPEFDPSRLRLLEPLGYLEFLALQYHATFVVTDSGGIQEETTYLGKPCITLRENTERPVTIDLGTNVLVGNDMDRLRDQVSLILLGIVKSGQVPPLWDGIAGQRIAEIIANY
jgi:UDP-N-acetylglucosamine 2-epimerase (non-hydrolysing)